MIAERPFVSKWSIVGSYRPGGKEQREGVFKVLRQKRLVSDGIVQPLRDRGSGRLAGQIRLYSVLNQDAARLARHGALDDALRLVAEAGAIERGRDAGLIVGALADRAPATIENSDEILSHGLDRLAADERIRAALLRVGARVERARRRSKRLGEISQVALGRVARFRGQLAEIVLEGEDGGVVVVDVNALADHHVDWLGAPVVLHCERWGNGQSFLETGPGIALDEPDKTLPLSERFGFLQRDEEVTSEAWEGVSALAAGPATIRISREVPVTTRPCTGRDRRPLSASGELHPRRIPGAEQATVDEGKPVGYLLHPDGKDPAKARYFASLGHTRGNWQDLRHALLERLTQVEGRFQRTNAAGWENWAARIVLPGPERPAAVETIWEVRPGEPPRLVTAFPAR